MASTLHTFLPATRSGQTFFFALTLLGAGALTQLLVLGGYLLRGGIAPRPAAEIHFAESLPATGVGPLTAPVRLEPTLPTPAPVTLPPAESATTAESSVMTRPTPAPVARYQAGSGDLLEQARQLRARGDMNSALARLREAQVAESDNPGVIAEMALTYEALQIPDRAVEQWQRLYNLGEGVGALYYLADTKLHAPPRISTPAWQSGTSNLAAASMQTGGPTINDAAVLKLADVHREDIADPSAEQEVSLKIVVKNRPGTVIDPTKVVIHTYFYDLVDGKDIVLTDAETKFAWLTTAPVNWAGDKSEVLETTYLRPKSVPAPVPTAEPEPSRIGKGHTRHGKVEPAEFTALAPGPTPAPVRVYGGYTVRLYYDHQLQDAQADPIALLQRFPPPVTLSSE